MKVVSFLGFLCFTIALWAGNSVPDSISYYMKDGQRIIIYEVDAGESLYKISEKYAVSIDDILALNPSIKDRQIREGQIIKIPVGKKAKPDNDLETAKKIKVHTVQKGETLYAISRKYDVPVGRIIAANKGLKPDNLRPGQKINIPLEGKEQKEEQEQPRKQETEEDEQEQGGPKYSFPTKTGKGKKEKYIYHEVEAGETMYAISRKYDVMVTDLMDWNKLENFNIDVGQKLIVGKRSDGEGTSGEEPQKNEQEGGEAFAGDNDEPAHQDEPDKELPAPGDSLIAGGKEKKEVKKDKRKNKKEDYQPRETLISLEYKEHLSSKGYREMTDKAIGRWMKNVEGYPLKNGYFALHKTLPIGTIIKVTNPVNQRIVYAKVIGHLPSSGPNNDIQVKLPEAASKELKAFDDISMLQISYLQEQNSR